MRSTYRAFVVGLLVLILVAGAAVILWPSSGETLIVHGEDQVTSAEPVAMPERWPQVHVTTTTTPPTTTTSSPPPPQTTTTTRAPRPASPAAPVEPVNVSAFLRCVAKYESGSNYASVGGGMYGIIDSTWRNSTLGYSARYGTAHSWQASPAAQDAAATDLYRRYGSRPWSTRSRCGG
jgi:hypothetical protein